MRSSGSSSLERCLVLTRADASVLSCYRDDNSGCHLVLGQNTKIEQSYFLPESSGSLQ